MVRRSGEISNRFNTAASLFQPADLDELFAALNEWEAQLRHIEFDFQADAGNDNPEVRS